MRWLSSVVLLALVPAPLAASSSSCSGGMFATCASVSVTTRWRPKTGYTFVDFSIRNLGLAGDEAIWFVNVSNVSTTKQLRGSNPAGPNGSGLANYTTRGPVGHAPDCTPVNMRRAGIIGCDALDDAWDSWCDPTQNAGCWPDEYEMFPYIVGCTAGGPYPFQLEGATGIQTCDRWGFTGSAVFSFAFEGKWKTKDLGIYLNNGNVCQVGKSKLPGYLAPCPMAAYTVTPEPATWILMLTGLAAVGIVARRRRRASA